MHRKEYLNQCLEYRDGLLFWKARPVQHFKHDLACRTWNRKFAGKAAGGSFFKDGKAVYMQVRINNVQLLAHRVIWEMQHGEIPAGMVIDHIDGDGCNNSAENLRLVSNRENLRNCSMSPRCATGVMGVSFCKRHNKWKVCIGGIKSRKHLGMFDCFLDACAKRKAAEMLCGYHKNHGRQRAELQLAAENELLRAEVERLRANQRP